MIQRHRLLIIDDDLILPKVCSVRLKNDFFIYSASNGWDGVQLALAHRPDIITVDMQMEGWDGIQTLQALRSHAELQSIPILMLTSDATKEVVVRAVDAGVDDYLLKDLSLHKTLGPRLKSLLGRTSGGVVGAGED